MDDPRTMKLVARSHLQHGPSFIVDTLVFEDESGDCYAYASSSMDWTQLPDDANDDPRPEYIEDFDIGRYLDKLAAEEEGE